MRKGGYVYSMPKNLASELRIQNFKTDQSNPRYYKSINLLEMSKKPYGGQLRTMVEKTSLKKKQGLMVTRVLLKMQGEDKSMFLLSLK